MDQSKRRLCVFAHYSQSKYIPYYVLLYLKELSLYFEEIILVTNKRTISNEKVLHHPKINILFVRNEGYDLGMFYKAFQTINPNEYRQIACINDSNILFNKLTTIFAWGKLNNLDFWGLIDSYETPLSSDHTDNYHIQSHFIVFNQKAIELLPAFFRSIDIEDIFKEADPSKLREIVINHWEIGVSQFMIKNGLSIGSFFDSKIYTNLYLSGKVRNLSRRLYSELIESGYPLIKKKVILDRKWRNFIRFKPSWKKMLRRHGKKEWEIERLVEELNLIRKST
jgi:lipopolysaccharide biosynthesis protein